MSKLTLERNLAAVEDVINPITAGEKVFHPGGADLSRADHRKLA